MGINSADRKPEKYVGPDGKTKIRMVPVDREVVKTEGGMKRIATNQSDKNADPKDKGLKTFKKLRASYESFEPHMMYDPKTGKGYKAEVEADHLRMKKMGYTHDKPEVKETYSMKEMVCKSCGDAYGKPTNEACMYDAYDMAGENWCSRKEYMTAQKKNEANTYVGQRDKMKIIGRKPHPDGGHIVTLQTQAGKTIKRHLKNGKVKDMNEEVKQVDEISKKTAQSYLDKTKGDDAFSGTRKANNRLKGAIHAVGIKRKKESVDEVLDTPGAMDRYHNKAKAQSDRARNSATAKIVRGNKDISKEKDIIRKREKGMDMATNVRAKQFRKAVTKRPYGESVEEDMNPYLKHSTDKLKNKHASFSRQIGDLQTKKLKGAKNPSIDQEIAKYQQKLRHVKNAMKSEATIPDGQTVMTKKPAISANDADKLSKIRKMLDKEKNK